MRNESNATKAVKEFHKAFGHPVFSRTNRLSKKRHKMRLALIKEEYKELKKAAMREDHVGIIDGLADLKYVIHGYALEVGADLDGAFREVHRSNMSKLGEDGKPIYRKDGKVLKGPNYSPPNLESYS